MRGHHVAVLAAVALIAIAATFWTNSVREPGENLTLVPGLTAKLNEVRTLRIVGGDGQSVTLARGDEAWTIAEKNGYPADKGKIAKFLIAAGDAVLLEEKTSNPEQYAQLGVGAPDSGEDGGARVEIGFGSGDPAPGFIVGKTARGATSTYVRRVDEARSWLTSGELSVEADPLSWLDREVISVPVNQVRSVTIRHPDGATLTIGKADPDAADFDVTGIPAGRELEYASVANPIASALAGLRLEDVARLESASAEERDPVLAEYLRFDGLVVTATLFAENDAYYAAFGVGLDEAQARLDWERSAQAMQAAAAEAAASDGEEAPPPREIAPPDLGAVQEEAAALAAKLAPWAFEISSSKYDQMTRTVADLLKDEAEEE